MSGELPPLHATEVSAGGVERLAAELAASAERLEVRARAGRGRPSAPPLELAGAIADLLAGRVRELELTYGHAGRRWRDTLLGLAPGVFRLTRVELPPERAGPSGGS